jgi:dihydroorotate dehydrogenase (fumarate)
MDLSTRYLGLDLPHPFMPGASPLVDSIDMVLRLEDAGAAAIVLSSLFEEDVAHHGVVVDRYLEHVLLDVKRAAGAPAVDGDSARPPHASLALSGGVHTGWTP